MSSRGEGGGSHRAREINARAIDLGAGSHRAREMNARALTR